MSSHTSDDAASSVLRICSDGPAISSRRRWR
jgi:hypothetical protein